MVEKYILNGDKLPTLPTPHDCEIVEIVCKDNFLIIFGEDENHTLTRVRIEET